MAGKGIGGMEDMAAGLLPYKCHPRHLPAPAAHHRRTHAHEPHLPTPAHDVARRILGEDVTQIENYTERVKWVVGKVLTGNGITRCERGTYAMVGGASQGLRAALELLPAETV